MLRQAGEDANGALASDMGDLLRLDDDAQPATESNPATATPDYLTDLLGDGAAAPSSTANVAPPIDLLDLLGGDLTPTPPDQAPSVVSLPFASYQIEWSPAYGSKFTHSDTRQPTESINSYIRKNIVQKILLQ